MEFEFKKEDMEKLGIAGIFLFGSQAQETATTRSDFDFAILLKNIKILSDNKRKNEIYEALYDILSNQIKRICDIDIVFIQKADLQFRHHVALDGVLLYSGDKKTVSDFLEEAIESYADFAPLRHIFHKAILQRI